MACRPQDNPRSASSDGVPPELVVLGLREAALCPTCLTNLASTYFLATPLGTDLHSSDAMTDDKVNPSKVDSTPVDVKYENIPEESRKQFEAQLKKEQEEATKRLLAYYGKTRQYSCCFTCFYFKRCKFFFRFH